MCRPQRQQWPRPAATSWASSLRMARGSGLAYSLRRATSAGVTRLRRQPDFAFGIGDLLVERRALPGEAVEQPVDLLHREDGDVDAVVEAGVDVGLPGT